MTFPPVPPPWDTWFPPLLDPGVAAGIGNEWWDEDPHWAAYLAWIAYAATLPPTASVSTVGTGTQTVTYSPAMPTGDYGAAIARAEWHRDLSGHGGLVSVPLTTYRAVAVPLTVDVWRVYDQAVTP